MTWWVGTRGCRCVLAFGMLSACSKCPPAAEPVAAGSEQRLILGSDGQPIGEGGPARYTSGESECPPDPEDTCPSNECGVHERVSCQQNCDGYRSQYYTCENGSYSLRETLEPACQCAPKKLPAELAACTARYVSVSHDDCTLGLTCAGRELWVECNDEEDSSECECWRDRQEMHLAGPVPGEGPDACFFAAAKCSKRR